VSFPPSPQPYPDVQRVLAIFAHPDDVDFAAAGTVARWVADGLEVTYVLVTRGDAGGFDDTPRAAMPAIREAEQRAAAAAVGVKQVEFLDGYADGTVTVTPALRRDLTRVIRRYRPDRILTNSPVRRWDRGLGGPNHPDHLAVGEAVCQAVYPDAGNPFAHPDLLAAEGLEPWPVREVWFSGGPAPDHYVDVTDTVDRKMAALRAHTSQLPEVEATSGRFLGYLAANATAAGLPAGRLAEAFTIVPAN